MPKVHYLDLASDQMTTQEDCWPMACYSCFGNDQQTTSALEEVVEVEQQCNKMDNSYMEAVQANYHRHLVAQMKEEYHCLLVLLLAGSFAGFH